MNVDLCRLTKDRGDAQRGVLIVHGQPEICTLELPWVANKPRMSCIPPGVYKCHKTTNRLTSGGTHIPVTFEVDNVPDRSGILFHSGNTSKDTMGCILLGQKFGILDSSLAVLESREAFAKFTKLFVSINDFSLRIYHG